VPGPGRFCGKKNKILIFMADIPKIGKDRAKVCVIMKIPLFQFSVDLQEVLVSTRLGRHGRSFSTEFSTKVVDKFFIDPERRRIRQARSHLHTPMVKFDFTRSFSGLVIKRQKPYTRSANKGGPDEQEQGPGNSPLCGGGDAPRGRPLVCGRLRR
jgi:hypothetical protein